MKDLLSISKSKLESFKIVDWSYTDELSPVSFEKYDSWVNSGGHGPLKYLSDERKDKRKTLRSVFPSCESALVFMFDYSGTKKTIDELNPEFKIASYSMGFDGVDYHHWIKEKLNLLGEELKINTPSLEFGISLDVHPVLERDLAYRSGLGWFGKNSMIINQKFGSYTLIGSLLLNQKLELAKNEIETDHCGNCTKCIDACPTLAIDSENRTVDATKCISTYTIELFKDAPAPKGYPVQSNEVFGCDICQEVCPWNLKPIEKASLIELDQDSLISFFNRPIENIFNDINEMSNNKYKTFFKGTSFERLGKRGLLKNLKHFTK